MKRSRISRARTRLYDTAVFMRVFYNGMGDCISTKSRFSAEIFVAHLHHSKDGMLLSGAR